MINNKGIIAIYQNPFTNKDNDVIVRATQPNCFEKPSKLIIPIIINLWTKQNIATNRITIINKTILFNLLD